MIVLDASAVVELLLETAIGRVVADRIADPSLGLHVPHLLDVEVAQVLRRYVRVGDISAEEGTAALAHLQSLDLQRHAHEPLLARVWELRDSLTAYDAIYVALAEVLEAKLLTCDKRLAGSPQATRQVELIES